MLGKKTINNIFTDKKLYPHEGKIMSHFRDCFDSVFVAFIPFFIIDKDDSNVQSFQKSVKIPFDLAQEKIVALKELSQNISRIVFATNEDYPSTNEIIKSGKLILWSEIILEAGFKSASELCQALQTSIGATYELYSMPELAEKLNRFTKIKKIWHPEEGLFDFASAVSIFKILKILGKNEVVISDEFYETKKILNIDCLNEVQFYQEIKHYMLYIYSADEEILFTIEWDSFFFLIATDKIKMDKLISSKLFEGFLCTPEAEHSWERGAGQK